MCNSYLPATERTVTISALWIMARVPCCGCGVLISVQSFHSFSRRRLSCGHHICPGTGSSIFSTYKALFHPRGPTVDGRNPAPPKKSWNPQTRVSHGFKVVRNGFRNHPHKFCIFLLSPELYVDLALVRAQTGRQVKRPCKSGLCPAAIGETTHKRIWMPLDN